MNEGECAQCECECTGNRGKKCRRLCSTEKKNKSSSKVSKQTHIVEETVDGVHSYYCTACHKRFRSRTQKYYHLECNQLHEKLFRCDSCPKTFSRQSQLKYHRESHASPVNKCSKCDKIFSNPLALKKHEGLHKAEPKPCPQCDKKFLKKTSLEEHIARDHMHNLPYACGKCNKKYSSKSTLQLHELSHEKKRFECNLCGKHFQRNSILNLHLKRHYQTTPNYKCWGCEKMFSELGALSRHRKIHEEDAVRYYCTLCDLNILRKDNMARHIKTIHPDESYGNIVQILKPTANINNQLTETITNKTEREDDVQQHVVVEPNDIGDNTSKNVESSNNVVIIENKLLQRPSTYSLDDRQTLNQIHVITALPATKQTDDIQQTSERSFEICQNDTTRENNKNEKWESRFQTQQKLPDVGDVQCKTQDPDLKSKESTMSTKESENIHQPIVLHTPSVIRSVGNVSKKIIFQLNDAEAMKKPKVSNSALDYEYKHKKYNHHYNVDLYRKILGITGDDDEDNEQENNNNNNYNSQLEEQPEVIRPRDQEECFNGNTNGNAAAVHWRKSFKHIYETSSM
ncbi:zinc finger and BTB domain-containing protein 24 isoform X1 [Musca domestica]|uniref:Zinc finger and BTB domain-containing protein 24 isoform X1 n=1 Tax=Musca domestica TaxID=7370 RepID=A0A9J7D705_MUSDO|nr:zinc finger and BTB domain-containing protein 24 isoform X1 [Musca domestica]